MFGGSTLSELVLLHNTSRLNNFTWPGRCAGPGNSQGNPGKPRVRVNGASSDGGKPVWVRLVRHLDSRAAHSFVLFYFCDMRQPGHHSCLDSHSLLGVRVLSTTNPRRHHSQHTPVLSAVLLVLVNYDGVGRRSVEAPMWPGAEEPADQGGHVGKNGCQWSTHRRSSALIRTLGAGRMGGLDYR